MIVFWEYSVSFRPAYQHCTIFNNTFKRHFSQSGTATAGTQTSLRTMAGYGDGQSHSSGSRTQLDGSSWRDMPQPLHITKRSDLRRGNQIARGSRRSSPESDGSSASMDSPPEPPGGRPLTLPKRRGDRGGWVTYPVGCTRDKDKGRGITDGWFPLISSHVCGACC